MKDEEMKMVKDLKPYNVIACKFMNKSINNLLYVLNEENQKRTAFDNTIQLIIEDVLEFKDLFINADVYTEKASEMLYFLNSIQNYLFTCDINNWLYDEQIERIEFWLNDLIEIAELFEERVKKVVTA